MPAKKIINPNAMTLKSKLTTLSVVAAILVTSSVAAFASSDFGNRQGDGFRQVECTYENAAARHLEMTGEELTEDMFSKMQEARELMKSGDKESAKEIMEELGVNPPEMRRMRGHKGPNLTDEQKEILKEAHNLKIEGDMEGAEELLQNAGIEFPGRR